MEIKTQRENSGLCAGEIAMGERESRERARNFLEREREVPGAEGPLCVRNSKPMPAFLAPLFSIFK